MNWVNICEETALPGFGGVAAWFDDTAIAIFNLGERGLFALDNTDPATGVSLLSRGLICDLEGDIFVASPLHKQHYSLRDGSCIEDESLSVNVYQVKCEDGRVLVKSAVDNTCDSARK
ncbi:nitrite reductase small subunit NirD [Shewanella eurypsychrophilus]|uniref:Nitrite reductase small subunit NirD n=1 Tax=Shewanella eurypsychrophilus TaxID=2593656 RepID=A0ABX6V4P9_9GAMM|nr:MULTISPECIES: nitrite reductase small subunit NirD [Shewanella]QFU22346.1 nitrite reductase small subunit NirD [Shewanella sp. YLB-09]QPG57632.1 nitrite reductase small subunit NirD [Shewanella eurypsychrophilus]